MTIPVWIQGAVRGSLSVSADGLYTLLRADCEPRKELIRLWAHSGGRSACIGVLAPLRRAPGADQTPVRT